SQNPKELPKIQTSPTIARFEIVNFNKSFTNELSRLWIDIYQRDSKILAEIEKLAEYPEGIFLAKISDKFVGFVITDIIKEKDDIIGEILRIGVHPKSRKRGVAINLLNTVSDYFSKKKVTKISFTFRKDDVEIIKLAEKFGLTVEKELRLNPILPSRPLRPEYIFKLMKFPCSNPTCPEKISFYDVLTHGKCRKCGNVIDLSPMAS
ncbi:MAG: GNAT family N-acetyltransferase, partial [Candidatus Helarchaeota archaeon]